ncbi:MAG: methylmalonyl-CoA mutase family protein [Lutibacter sp.]
MNLDLTQDFNAVSSAVWKQNIQFELKGKAYENLLTQTLEGITIKPFYHSDQFRSLSINLPNSYQNTQTVWINSETEANKFAINAVENDIQSLKFIANHSFDFKVVFENLLNKNITFIFEFDFLDIQFLKSLKSYLKDEKVFLNIDPIGQLVKTGNWFENYKIDFENLKLLLNFFPNNHIIGINSKTYQNAGANIVQQIAYTLAHLNEYLTNFDSSIIPQVTISVGSHFFFEIAKLRALRHLIQLLYKNHGYENLNFSLFVEPSKRNKTILDFNVNSIRTTTECMSAIIGGSDFVANLPYDYLFKNQNEFSNRIARNQLLILKEESYFKNNKDYTKSNYYIEEITNQLAEKSLKLFKNIEKSGGFLKQLFLGTIQRKIKENAIKEQDLYNNNILKQVGINSFQSIEPFNKKLIEKDLKPNKKSIKTLIEPVLSSRIAEKEEFKKLNL